MWSISLGSFFDRVDEVNKSYSLLLDGSLDVLVSQVLVFVKLEVVRRNVALLGQNSRVEGLEDLSKLVDRANAAGRTSGAAND